MAFLGDIAAEAPDRPAVIMAGSGDTLTYGELYARSNRFARLLHDAGLRPGDHYAVMAENHIRYFEVVWAGLNSGLYVTAINSKLTPEELSYILEDCNAKVLVTSKYLAETAERVVPGTPGVTRRLMFDGTSESYESYEDAVEGYSGDPLGPQPRGTFMLYSSGTTGRPKGVKFPLPGWDATGGDGPMVVSTAGLFQIAGDGTDVYLSPAPLYHAAPLRVSTCVHCLGGTVVVMERFDAVEALKAIERYGVTSSQWVPTMFVRLTKLPREERERHDLSTLKVAVHAAAPCPVEVKAQMIEWWGPIIFEYYAGTENIGTTALSSQEWLAHRGSVGRAITGELHICDDDGDELPPGEVGLVYFFTPEAAFEYHGDPGKTASMENPKHPGWRTLGDIGYTDTDGYLYLTDRKAFMIIAGGVNIYPAEIEDVLIVHPSVIDVAVFGIPNPDLGEEVKAVVQVAEIPADPTDLVAELQRHCREHLAAFKCPRSIDLVTELPRLDNGKLYKRLLRDAYWPK